MRKLNCILITLIVLVAFSCKDHVFPKPKGLLSLKYKSPTYKKTKVSCGFSFSQNSKGKLKKTFKNQDCGFVVDYPELNASMYLSYRKVDGNLNKLLTDAQNLTQEHVVKADEIVTQPYEDKKRKVYGMLYEVLGDAASQSQFYVTDSISHFLLGSVYFNVKPNYDSIYPAAVYLQKDMRKLIETLNWEE